MGKASAKLKREAVNVRQTDNWHELVSDWNAVMSGPRENVEAMVKAECQRLGICK